MIYIGYQEKLLGRKGRWRDTTFTHRLAYGRHGVSTIYPVHLMIWKRVLSLVLEMCVSTAWCDCIFACVKYQWLPAVDPVAGFGSM